jgi:CxxC motif-containing protein (DUF1111 family)
MSKSYFTPGFGLILFLMLLFITGCQKPAEFSVQDLDERMSGGLMATTFDAGVLAYGQPVSGLSQRDEQVFAFGDKMFETQFVQGPATVFSGLGPLYNQTSCAGCHNREGRGRMPDFGDHYESAFFKISLPGKDEHGAPLPVPGFGHQIQDRAVFGENPEARVRVDWLDKDFTYPDGTKIKLRYPQFTVQNTYRPFPEGVLLSPRLSRPNYGMGLVDAIPEENILRNADPNDANKDGISGKANFVYDFINGRNHVLGKIGWKASVVNVKSQVARAFLEDIGVTSSIFPQKIGFDQEQYRSAYIGPGPDVPDSVIQALTFYMQALCVPARRNVDDPDVVKGQSLFKGIGCVKCHVDVQKTKVDSRFKPVSGQIIRPYSDFLLHDLGPDLSDGRPEYDAEGSEWRTPPLWGIGLSKKVSGHGQLLHDGRARSFEEAILWHGGEAEKVRQTFTRLSATSRKSLLKFLESL